ITSNTQEGFAILEECEKQQLDKESHNLKTYRDLLNICSGNFNEESYDSADGKHMASTFNSFSSGDYETAMKHYSLLNQSFSLTNMNLSINYLPLHFELCHKRSGRAKLLLQEKIKKGDDFYLDDLFYGR